MPRDILVFRVGGHRLALPAEIVREVTRAVTITPLPESPDVVAGTIDVRGHAVAVFDLRRRFGLPTQTLDPSHIFILARAGSRDVGLWVDHAESLETSGPVVSDEGLLEASRHVAGVARVEGGLVLIQDLEAFLTSDESVSLDRALARSEAGEPA